MPSALTVLARIEPGREDALRVLFPETGQRVFEDSPSTHIANWAIIEDEENGQRLVLASNYDGGLADYVAEMKRVGGEQLDQIWSHCEGWEGLDGLLRFVRRNSVKSQVYFAAFQGETAERIRHLAAVRQQLESFLDLDDVAAFVAKGGVDAIVEQIAAGQPTRPQVFDDPIGDLFRAIRRFLHQLFFKVVLWLAEKYGQWRVDDSHVSVASNIDRRQETVTFEPGLINHMTNVVTVRRGRGLLLRFSLALTDFLGKQAWPPGELAGVRTIHFARWALIDNGRRMLFQGNFDGSWENYMGDFVDKIAWGLDAIWSNSEGYPSAGMRDIWSFMRFIRERQFQPLAVYRAYPDVSTLNTIRDRETIGAIERVFDHERVQEWLRRL